MARCVRTAVVVLLALLLPACQVDFSKGFDRFYANIPGSHEDEDESEVFAREMEHKYGQGEDGEASLQNDGGTRAP